MNRNDLINKKENYLVGAKILCGDYEFENIPCKLYLPERIHEKPKIILKPSSKDARSIAYFWKCSIEAKVTNFSGDILVTIKSPELYITKTQANNWGKNLSESTVYCDPENLEVIQHTKSREDTKLSTVFFWITPNSFITPFALHEQSFDGNVKQEALSVVTHKIGCCNFNFIKNFRYKTEENDDIKQWSHLVSECKTKINAVDTQRIFDEHIEVLDDFLLLTSLASRHKTACLGWNAYDSSNYVDYYRGNYTFPEIRKTDINESLVDISKFNEFISRASKSFSEYTNKLSLRISINSALSAKDNFLENSFLAIFSGLEALILEFRRNEGFEFIVSDSDWPNVRRHIEKSIKSLEEPKLTSKQRGRIYSKLDELNRISLRDAFEMFCSHYVIPHEDLWPLFGNEEQAGLSDIRNRLIHGDPLPNHMLGILISAQFQLRILLERALLRVLDWNINDSNVSKRGMALYSKNMTENFESSKKIKQFLTGG